MQRSHLIWGVSLACLVLLTAASPAAAQWGDLTGQIVLEGELPTLPPKVAKGDPAAKDPAVCAVTDIPDYTFKADPSSRGVADVFVYVRKPTQVNPKLAPVPTDELIVDQKQCQFIPFSLIVRCDQQVVAKSQDPIPHNIHGYNIFNGGFNFTVAGNDRTGQKVPIDKANARPEPLPIPVKCDIHTHMESYWLVVDHPYAAVTDAEGKFEIKGLPVGKNTLTIWHNTTGYVWKTIDVDVKPDGTTLPLKVEAAMVGGKVKLVPVK